MARFPVKGSCYSAQAAVSGGNILPDLDAVQHFQKINLRVVQVSTDVIVRAFSRGVHLCWKQGVASGVLIEDHMINSPPGEILSVKDEGKES